MTIRKLFTSAVSDTRELELVPAKAGVEICFIGYGGAAVEVMVVDPDDIPALIAELRRVAKLAKQAMEAHHG